MATEAAPATETVEAPKGKRKVMMLGAAGVFAGSAAGFFGAGPMLTKGKTAAPAEKHAEKLATASVVHAVENLVLNPAGSNGTRFLMCTATFELKDAEAGQSMTDHDSEVRDRILAVLGKKSVDELSDITQKDAIKKEVLESIAPMFAKGAVVKVFFPQFVIQ